MLRRLFHLVAVALFSAGLLTACESLAYYSQAASGQLSIMWNRQSIESLLADETLPEHRRIALEQVQEARRFAIESLGMDIDGSYLSYVELDREHVIWNVFAAPELSLAPLNWCFPLAGCVSYRGYFSAERARRYAERLAEQGYDVYIGGVDAYSTLGWFDDPLLSTVLDRPPHRLAGLVFHELAHQQVYLPGDTTFNESFASYVEREALRQWLLQEHDPALFAQYREEEQRRADFVALVSRYVDKLDALYGSDVDESVQRQKKAAIQQDLRASYQELTRQWGVNAYSGWFEGPLNNAQLATVTSYNDDVSAFAALMAESGDDWRMFFASVRSLADLPVSDRKQALARLSAAAQGTAGTAGSQDY